VLLQQQSQQKQQKLKQDKWHSCSFSWELETPTTGALCAVVYCALCAVCCALCAVCCALCAVRCALCAVRCALCAVRCALCAVRCALCAVRCALCAVRSLLPSSIYPPKYTSTFLPSVLQVLCECNHSRVVDRRSCA
jgi:hypothetical protein